MLFVVSEYLEVNVLYGGIEQMLIWNLNGGYVDGVGTCHSELSFNYFLLV